MPSCEPGNIPEHATSLQKHGSGIASAIHSGNLRAPDAHGLRRINQTSAENEVMSAAIARTAGSRMNIFASESRRPLMFTNCSVQENVLWDLPSTDAE
jgi:hypothetical protein